MTFHIVFGIGLGVIGYKIGIGLDEWGLDKVLMEPWRPEQLGGP